MADVVAGENESFESLIKRFSKKVQQAGVLSEARRREHYEKPTDKRKRKAAKRHRAIRTNR